MSALTEFIPLSVAIQIALKRRRNDPEMRGRRMMHVIRTSGPSRR